MIFYNVDVSSMVFISQQVGLPVSAHSGDQLSPLRPHYFSTYQHTSCFPVLSCESKSHFYKTHPTQERTDLRILFLLLGLLPQAL